jgi:hypothetical protein
MEKEFTVQYFINKFEKIPEDKWCMYERNSSKGQHCAHGWCSIGSEGFSPQERALMDIAKANPILLQNCHGFAPINNGHNPMYQQPTPKQRILAALYDIRAKQNPSDPYAVTLSQSLHPTPSHDRRRKGVV